MITPEEANRQKMEFLSKFTDSTEQEREMARSLAEMLNAYALLPIGVWETTRVLPPSRIMFVYRMALAVMLNQLESNSAAIEELLSKTIRR